MDHLRLPKAINLIENPDYKVVNIDEINISRAEYTASVIRENNQLKTYLILTGIGLSISIIYILAELLDSERKKTTN